MNNYHVCPRCGNRYPIAENRWECECGSVFELEPTLCFDHKLVHTSERGLWRYRHMLPVDEGQIVSMGEGWTPLETLSRSDEGLLVKLEYTNPTGSYKDRGATVQVSKLLEVGVREVVEDSSGNAGAALSAYTARAGIRCHIYVPASHSAGKMRQIQAYGADLVPVEGTRKDTTLAAMEAGRKLYYASHAHTPLYVEGCKTIAYELWEQMGGRAPGMVVCPLGQGSILLGLYKGFGELVAGGYIPRLPRLVGVQAEACAPIALAFEQGLDRPVEVSEVGHTIAEGIKLPEPVRGVELLRAIRASGGTAVAVGEQEIAQARTDLAKHGYYVEPTSAVTLAGYRRMTPLGDGPAVLVLTGSGLKSTV